MSTQSVVTKGISLYPHQWQIVQQFAQDQGYDSLASALRRIVEEWSQFKRVQLIDTRESYHVDQIT